MRIKERTLTTKTHVIEIIKGEAVTDFCTVLSKENVDGNAHLADPLTLYITESTFEVEMPTETTTVVFQRNATVGFLYRVLEGMKHNLFAQNTTINIVHVETEPDIYATYEKGKLKRLK